ncbi:hypothetical protein [Anaplasma bovis]|uniref:hypothetical protein n=1 Tax=Anaplasma bovis TaxID=186733 RepID=UPI002FEF73EC
MAEVKGQRSSGGVFDASFNIRNLVQVPGVLTAMEGLTKLAEGVVGSRFRELEFCWEIVRSGWSAISCTSYSCIGISLC